MDLSVFDSWEPIEKARKAKGLEKWSKLAHMADKLKGKKHSDITFTTGYPGQEGKQKVLGSIEGNLHFLMGYANPAFYFAPYHLQVMDPNLSDEEAEELYDLRGHPSRMELWIKSGVEAEDEGDLALGQPHPKVVADREAQEEARKKEAEGKRISWRGGRYFAVPSEGLVYSEHDDRIYHWDMLRDSFFAADNEEIATVMNDVSDALSQPEESEETEIDITKSFPDSVLYHADQSTNEFDDSVYGLVKSLFPKPGSVVTVSTPIGEEAYAVIEKSCISFFDRHGERSTVNVYGRDIEAIPLTHDGDVFKSVVYSFAKSVLGLDYIDNWLGDEPPPAASPRVYGSPTPGFENIESNDLSSMRKSVVVDGNRYRLKLGEKYV